VTDLTAYRRNHTDPACPQHENDHTETGTIIALLLPISVHHPTDHQEYINRSSARTAGHCGSHGDREALLDCPSIKALLPCNTYSTVSSISRVPFLSSTPSPPPNVASGQRNTTTRAHLQPRFASSRHHSLHCTGASCLGFAKNSE
jgi:hypothetical protein